MPVDVDERFTLFEHLDELRKRLMWSLVALAVGVLVAAVFNSIVFELLLYPLKQVPNLDPAAYKLTTFSPAEPFMTSLKIWVVVGIMLAAPFLIWQMWAYVGPAFTSTEKRYFYPVVIATTALFLGGVVFGYLVVLPKGLQFLLGFGSGNFNIQNRASDYFTFVALFVLAFGAVFEMPVVLVLLAKVGVIDDKFLRKNRRYAILIMRHRRGRHHAQPGRLLDAGHVHPAGGPLRDLHPARSPGAAEEASRRRRRRCRRRPDDDLSRAPA